MSDGQDLSDIFEKQHATAYSNYLLKSPATRAVYPLNTTSIYYGGDSGSFGVWNGTATTNTDINGSINNSIRAIYARNTSNVYIGGGFTSVSGSTNLAYLTKYSGGTTFSQVGSPVLNGIVYAMSALDPSNVFIGGDFTNIGTHITRLNTYSSLFTGLSTGLNDTVRAISVLDQSNVYIGGDFTNGGNIGNYITRWNGTQFNRLGSEDLSGGSIVAIHALDPSHVYIGGTFARYGTDTSMCQIAMWDGQSITALGSGIPIEVPSNGVRAIYALDENHVYIGGQFNHIKMWNGSSFDILSGSLPLSSCQALNMIKNDKTTLYIAGGGGGNSGVQKRIT